MFFLKKPEIFSLKELLIPLKESKAPKQPDQKILAKKSNTLLFYSNRYLHCMKPYCEINFKNVSVITEKMANKLHSLIYCFSL